MTAAERGSIGRRKVETIQRDAHNPGVSKAHADVCRDASSTDSCLEWQSKHLRRPRDLYRGAIRLPLRVDDPQPLPSLERPV